MPLVALSQARDYHFAMGMFDVRGWNVSTLVDDDTVGTVHDLLLDGAGEPRYLDVCLGAFGKHVLLPIGQARASQSARTIRVPGFTRDQFQYIPEYRHDADRLGRGDEATLLAAYADAYAGVASRPHPPFTGTVYGPSEPDAVSGPHPPPGLAPLSRLEGCRIAEGEPDPRAWAVYGSDRRRIGTVDELLVDTRAGKVRYLVCEIDERRLGLEPRARHTLIPIGFARLDPPREAVLIDGFRSDAVAATPIYSGQQLTRELERDVLAPYAAGTGFYDDPRLDPRGFYGPAAA